MQISLFVTLSVLFAGVMGAPSPAPSPAGGIITPRDTIPGNSPSGPGGSSPNDKYPGEIQRWSYPDPKTLKSWPAQPKSSMRNECSLEVQVSVGSCAAGAYSNKPFFIPYDAPSTKAIEGKVKFNVKHDGGDYYDNTSVTLDCYWRGRVMVTDTPELQSRIGLVSVRIDTSPQGSRAWVTADPDEETGMKQTQVAPIGFVEFGKHEANNKNWSNARGFATSLKTTKNKADKLFIQVC